jgi:glycine betaine/proline transport system ATP-binding protein
MNEDKATEGVVTSLEDTGELPIITDEEPVGLEPTDQRATGAAVGGGGGSGEAPAPEQPADDHEEA